ncbi:hypothetical protein T484DRAFT_1852968 [Baffinella frigidus]|nr:hypothetical protein T484DRAFT_1852968 [Cryptophyta sp. CCMP2293]
MSGSQDGDPRRRLRLLRSVVGIACCAAVLGVVALSYADGDATRRVALNGIDSDMESSMTSIMQYPTERDEHPKSAETHEARQMKGDLMMERDLIKHMKMVLALVTNGEPMPTKDAEAQIKRRSDVLYQERPMVRAQVTNGEPMGTKDVEAQIKFLKEDIDFLLLNPESSGYTNIPYDSRKRRLELAQRVKSLVDYLQYRLVTEHGCSIHARVKSLVEG